MGRKEFRCRRICGEAPAPLHVASGAIVPVLGVLGTGPICFVRGVFLRVLPDLGEYRGRQVDLADVGKAHQVAQDVTELVADVRSLLF